MGEIPVTITPPSPGSMKKMSLRDREKTFKDSFQYMIESNKEFLILDNPQSKKLIQFAFDHETKNIFLDIPLQELSEAEYLKCKAVLGEKAVDVILGQTIALQEEYPFKQIGAITEIVEKIFLYVFHLPTDYSVNVDVF